MKDYFYQLADFAVRQISDREILTLHLSGEISEFVRFNKARIRQCGSVNQSMISLRLIEGGRSCDGNLTLTHVQKEDQQNLLAEIGKLRQQVQVLPPDPHLIYSTTENSTEYHGERQTAPVHDIVQTICQQAGNFDLVGVLATGQMFSGFADSFGQRNWFDSSNFNFDFSLYLQGDKAVKSGYAGFKWNNETFAQKLQESAVQLEVLKKPSVDIKPGPYPVYLSPSGMVEVMSLLSWGGFSLRSFEGHQSPLLKLYMKQETLHSMVSITEDTKHGLAPNFNSQGFIRPDEVSLISQGKAGDLLVSPRVGKEYGRSTNGATPSESPESLAMAAGGIKYQDVLKTIGTGLYINNLHYLNYSDLTKARVTGMTRFATFWVENGEIVQPVNVIRFDDTIYNLLGSNLIGLTAERDFVFSEMSYFQRSRSSFHLPGALISAMNFTL